MDRNATRLTGQYLDTGATTHTFRVNGEAFRSLAIHQFIYL